MSGYCYCQNNPRKVLDDSKKRKIEGDQSDLPFKKRRFENPREIVDSKKRKFEGDQSDLPFKKRRFDNGQDETVPKRRKVDFMSESTAWEKLIERAKDLPNSSFIEALQFETEETFLLVDAIKSGRIYRKILKFQKLGQSIKSSWESVEKYFHFSK